MPEESRCKYIDCTKDEEDEEGEVDGEEPSVDPIVEALQTLTGLFTI